MLKIKVGAVRISPKQYGRPKKLRPGISDVYPRFFPSFTRPLTVSGEKTRPPQNSYGTYGQGLH